MIKTSDTHFAAYLVHKGHTVNKMEANGTAKTVYLLFRLEEEEHMRLHGEYLKSEYFQVTMIKDTLTKSIKGFVSSSKT